MRKIPLLLIVLLLSFMLNAQSFTKTYNEGQHQYTLQFTPIDGATCSVKCTAFPEYKETNLSIPSQVNNGNAIYDVSIIEDYAFVRYDDGLIQSGFHNSILTIPPTITEIGEYAFNRMECDYVLIPSSVKSIGAYAFEELKRISLNNPNNDEYPSVLFFSTTAPDISLSTEGDNYICCFGKISKWAGGFPVLIYVPNNSIDKYKEAWKDCNKLCTNNLKFGIPTFIGTVDNNYLLTDNWSLDPNNAISFTGENAIVAINGNVIISDNVTIRSLGICGSYNECVHELSGSVTLDLNNSGQLTFSSICNDIKMKKEIIGYENNSENGWYTISSPFYTITETNLMNSEYDLFRFDEPSSTWINAEGGNGFNELELGHGYLYAHSTGTEIEMIGMPNSDNIVNNISNKGTNLKGFNLIGNPFTHNITMANLDMSCQRAVGFYTLENSGNWVVNEEAASIGPSTGFLIKVAGNLDNYDLTINKEANYKGSEKSKDAKLAINVSNKRYNDKAYVYFKEGLGLDKISHLNKEIPMVSVSLDNTQYAIATVNEETKSIPVRFEAKTMGEYTIEVKAEDYDVDKLILVDRMNGTRTDMLTDTYTFIATSNDNPNRFIILLNEDAEETAALNSFIYINNKELVISNIQGNATIDIYDILGRNIATYRCSDDIQRISTESLSTGLYIVRKADESGINVQKIIIE